MGRGGTVGTASPGISSTRLPPGTDLRDPSTSGSL